MDLIAPKFRRLQNMSRGQHEYSILAPSRKLLIQAVITVLSESGKVSHSYSVHYLTYSLHHQCD